ncbi:MAG TPA: ribonuclease HII [Terriglobales bacterium]|nr:ribonuclease HII [Terriglobales bacterium]
MPRKPAKPLPLKKDGTPMSAAAAKMKLLKSLKCTSKFEKKAWAGGARLVAGVDEVGRGCLFGPVVAAAVILEPEHRIRGLRDSKLIPEETREALAVKIRDRAIAISISFVDVETIDRINIYHASRLAMLNAVAQLLPLPDHLLVDAMVIDFPSATDRLPQTKIIHGDALSASIAAASIIAKVERDRFMRELAPKYPHYDLASNKGYSAPKHLAALKQFGPTPLHRMSFAPVWTSHQSQETLAFMTESGESVISGDVNVEEVLLTESAAAGSGG